MRRGGSWSWGGGHVEHEIRDRAGRAEKIRISFRGWQLLPHSTDLHTPPHRTPPRPAPPQPRLGGRDGTDRALAPGVARRRPQSAGARCSAESGPLTLPTTLHGTPRGPPPLVEFGEFVADSGPPLLPPLRALWSAQTQGLSPPPRHLSNDRMGARPTKKGLGEGALLVSTCIGEVNFSFARCRGNAGGGDAWAEKRGAL